MWLRSSVLLWVLVAGFNSANAAEYLLSEQAKSLNLPFSEAVRVGDMLYLSGQLGTLPGTTDLAGGGIEGETKQVMDNIKSILERYGSSMDKIVKCTVTAPATVTRSRRSAPTQKFHHGPASMRIRSKSAGA